jgi:hypothetical protein
MVAFPELFFVRLTLIPARIAASLAALVLFPGCRKAIDDHSASGFVRKEQPGFNSHIQPVLSQNCYHCHGPDSGSRKGGLRLDIAEAALKGGESGRPAFVPGKPELSEAILRILSKDPQEMMPPPGSHVKMDASEVELLKEWIRGGAAYEPHWSFIPPQKPGTPAVERTKWPRNPIDFFVLARLEKEDLAPAPEATKAERIRRVTYDLTGLPPTPEEIFAFEQDTSPEAYERVVDRLLASSRYGEHRARYWLDVARYGDSHGLHGDTSRTVWPYRDYVVRAFNQNKGFDQFTRENVAGDLLPPRTLDQQLASAYIRLGISTGEGGVIHQEVRVNNARERAEAIGSAYMGVTMGCAACHDHKFDPISQRDFFQLTAYFNNLSESPVNGERPDWRPSIKVPPASRLEEYNRILGQRADSAEALSVLRRGANSLVADWIKSGRDPALRVPVTGLEARLKFSEGQGGQLVNSAAGAVRSEIVATGPAPIWGEDTLFWPSMRFDSSTSIAMSELGDVDISDSFAVGGWVKLLYERPRGESVHGVLWSRRGEGESQPGWEVYFYEGQIEFRLAGSGLGNAVAIRTVDKVLEGSMWTHVLVTADGSGSASGLRILLNGIRVETTVVADSLRGSIRATVPLHLGRRHPDHRPMRQTSFQDFRFYRARMSDDEAKRVAFEDYVAELIERPDLSWNEDERFAVTEFYLKHRNPEAARLLAGIGKLDEKLQFLSEQGVSTMVSEEAPRLAYADVLTRGEYTQRQERVRPATPHFLPRLPEDAPKNRLGLANWLVSDMNPLTARVTVNRMWSELFGTGIVETTDDFGTVGARPSHPDLLDWLAVDFQESGWNIKRFYKQVVMSATYQQSAGFTPEKLERDPSNRLLSRGPRYRMDGEVLRDAVLATSGLLVEEIGGPSVKPYQPPGIWETVAIPANPAKDTSVYTQDQGDALYRRSLYTFWKRMSPMPNVSVLDAPDRDVACTRRQRTNTPLQALTLLNDVQWLEAARVQAEGLVRDYATIDARLDRLALLSISRPWTPSERDQFRKSWESFSQQYPPGSIEAATLIEVGDSQPDPLLPSHEVAVWMLLSSAAHNLDASLNK